MVTELTGMSISNASLLDEGTAAAEAMLMCFSALKRTRKLFVVDKDINPQTIACVKTRADGFGIEVLVGDIAEFDFNANKEQLCGILLQYPTTDGRVLDPTVYVQKAHDCGAQVACATDLLSLTILKPPGEFGIDIAFGNSQRFGVPMGYGGPHAAFFACKDEHKRRMPGRLIGKYILFFLILKVFLRILLVKGHTDYHCKLVSNTFEEKRPQAIFVLLRYLNAIYSLKGSSCKYGSYVCSLPRSKGFERNCHPYSQHDLLLCRSCSSTWTHG
jgi:hypothetical protein